MTKLRNDSLDMLLARTLMLLRDAGNFTPSDADIYEAMSVACVDLRAADVCDASKDFQFAHKNATTYEFIRRVLALKATPTT